MVQLQTLKLKILIELLDGEGESMVTQQKIDEVAIRWNKTKDPKYKNLWYQLVKEFAKGPNNIERRVVSTNSSNRTDYGWNSVDK